MLINRKQSESLDMCQGLFNFAMLNWYIMLMLKSVVLQCWHPMYDSVASSIDEHNPPPPRQMHNFLGVTITQMTKGIFTITSCFFLTDTMLVSKTFNHTKKPRFNSVQIVISLSDWQESKSHPSLRAMKLPVTKLLQIHHSYIARTLQMLNIK